MKPAMSYLMWPLLNASENLARIGPTKNNFSEIEINAIKRIFCGIDINFDKNWKIKMPDAGHFVNINDDTLVHVKTWSAINSPIIF